MCDPETIIINDIWNHIAYYLSIKDLSNLFQTNSNFRSMFHKKEINFILEQFFLNMRSLDDSISHKYIYIFGRMRTPFWINLFLKANFKFRKLECGFETFEENFTETLILCCKGATDHDINMNFIKFALKYYNNILSINFGILKNLLIKYKYFESLLEIYNHLGKYKKYSPNEIVIPIRINLLIIPLLLNNSSMTINLLERVILDLKYNEESSYILEGPYVIKILNEMTKLNFLIDFYNILDFILEFAEKEKKDIILKLYNQLVGLLQI